MRLNASFPFEWRCPACQYEQWVRVKARGSGSLGLSGDTAVNRDLVKMKAAQNAWRAARMKLALRPCPKCGAIDRKTVAWIVVRTFIVSTSSSALLIGVATAQSMGDASEARWTWLWATVPYLVLLAVLIGAATTVFFWFYRWRASGNDLEAMEESSG